MISKISRILLMLVASTTIITGLGYTKVLAAVDCTSNDLTTQQAIQCGTNDSAGVPGGGTPVNDLNTTIDNLVNIISAFVGVVAVIMIIVGGFRYVTSAGSAEGAKGAKNTILYAVIGLVIVAFAQILVHFVINKTSTATANSGSSSIGASSAPTRTGP